MLALAARFWLGASVPRPEAMASTATLDSALATWSQQPPRRAMVRAQLTPDARQRDWLVALARTGSVIAWTAGDSVGGALLVESGPLPEALARLTALGAPRSRVMLSDRLGRVDSARIGLRGAASWGLRPLGAVSATIGASRPVAEARDSIVTKPVLLIGAAGWETKFVAAALEEDGWRVSTRITVAPGAVVRQGSATVLDTATYGAVILLDSLSPLDAGALTRFVRDGGGLVAAGPGVRHAAARMLLPRTTSEVPGTLGALLGPTPRDGLNGRTFAAISNGVVFERREGAPLVFARRIGSGRAIAVGYDDTWRLRMIPPDDGAPARHRAWWSMMVGSVARAGLVARDVSGLDEAPFAATVAALGAPVAEGAPGRGPVVPWDALLAAIAAAALLGEWFSRRLRGVA